VTRPLLIVGVDGLPPTFLQRLIDGGRMPTFARLARDGALGVLRSTPNYQSASAWSSFATGVNPGQHGVFHFTNPVRGSYRFAQIDARARCSPTIWRMLSDAGIRVAALNVPVSYPAEAIGGVMVAGWLCPSAASAGFTHPPEVARGLTEYPIHPEVRRHASTGDYAAVAHHARRGILAKLELARLILLQERPDILCVVVTETDSLQHWCWHLLDAGHPEHRPHLADRWRDELLAPYEALDHALGGLLHAAGKCTDLMVVSDHGQSPNSGGQLLLRPWLIHRGYLVPARRTIRQRVSDAIMRAGFEAIRRHAGNRLKSRLRARFPEMQARAQAGVRGVAAEWPRTRAWTECGHIFINTRGTWPQGCVEPGPERTALLEELREGLLDLRDAETGEPAVASVTFGDHEFAGSQADLMADLLVHWRTDLRITRLRDADGTVIERPDAPEVPFGAHHPDGTLVTCGPSFAPIDDAREHSIYDVAPTALHLLGQPVPAHFDGHVMTDLMAVAAAKDVRSMAVNVTSDRPRPRPVGDDAIVTERLRSLGYIE